MLAIAAAERQTLEDKVQSSEEQSRISMNAKPDSTTRHQGTEPGEEHASSSRAQHTEEGHDTPSASKSPHHASREGHEIMDLTKIVIQKVDGLQEVTTNADQKLHKMD